MNGVYLRALSLEEYGDRLVGFLGDRGWPEDRVHASVPLVQGKIERLAQYPEYAGFLFDRPEPTKGDAEILKPAIETLEGLEPFTAAAIEQGLRDLVERLGQKPRQAFQPIRVAVTGSTISPGLFESIEFLGREETLERLRSAKAASA